MMKVTLVKALLLQVAVVAVGIMVLSRPGADGMGVVETITGKSESIITADRLSGDVVGYQRPVPMTTQPLPDLSGVDFVGLARAQYGRCGEYRALALAVGWPAEQWPKISKVMYRESRCNFDSFNPTDPNGGSRGLMQINGFWCRPNRYTSQGYLQDKGVLKTCDDLYVPEINIRAALSLWLYSEERNGCGWRPWATSCR